MARRKASSHLCEIDGSHWNVPAAGYVVSETYDGHIVYVWGCAECRDWWFGRHPDAAWTDWNPE